MTKARIRQLRDSVSANSGARFDCGDIIHELLDEIELLQSFSRRGEKPKAEKLPPAAKVKVEKKTDPRIKELIDGWFDAYFKFHKTTYLVQGGKDASAAQRLISAETTNRATMVEMGEPLLDERPIVDALLDTAWEAWKHLDKFNCKQAVTISGFASRYNDIVVELKSTKVTAKAPAGASL